jgi:thiol:disulfide interchange protein DsbC
MLYLQRHILNSIKEIVVTENRATSAAGNGLKKTISIRSGMFVLAVILSCAFLTLPKEGQAFNASGCGSSGCESDCGKCHSLDKAEAVEIVKSMKIADARVLDVKMSPIKGLWEISINRRGKEAPVYIDFSKKYVIEGPIAELPGGADKTSDKTKEQYKGKKEQKGIDTSRISLKNALVLGSRKAATKVIVFTDPECPYCGVLHEQMKKVVEKRKDIAFYIRLFPLINIHPDAYWKSTSIVCKKSMKMLDDNFYKIPIERIECKTTEVDNTIKLAEKLKINGTPTLIFEDGSILSGAMSAEDLIKLIDSRKKQ